MPATILCNGITKKTGGVSVCQSRNELIQQIEFKETVVLSPDSDCDFGQNEGKKFKYNIKKGRCVYVFKNKTKDEFHRHTTIGYESILIRN